MKSKLNIKGIFVRLIMILLPLTLIFISALFSKLIVRAIILIFILILIGMILFILENIDNSFANTITDRFFIPYYKPLMSLIDIILMFSIGLFLPIISMIIAWILPYAIIKITSIILIINLNIQINLETIEPVLMYLSILIMMVLMAYNGENIIKRVNNMLTRSQMNKNKNSIVIAKEYYRHLDFRKLLYEISIFLYILSVIEELINIPIINLEIWNYYKVMSLETLLTFTAIDTYLSTFEDK